MKPSDTKSGVYFANIVALVVLSDLFAAITRQLFLSNILSIFSSQYFFSSSRYGKGIMPFLNLNQFKRSVRF